MIGSPGGAARAHEGEHAGDAQPPAVTGDSARRMPDGKVFVPKPTQRILDVRTAVAKPETQPRAVVLVGRVITNPNRSGLVQSINGGRVIAPEQGLPRLGQPVAKGDVLARVEPADADRRPHDDFRAIRELEQLIAVTEAKLQRLRTLAERGVALQSLVVEAEAGTRRPAPPPRGHTADQDRSRSAACAHRRRDRTGECRRRAGGAGAGRAVSDCRSGVALGRGLRLRRRRSRQRSRMRRPWSPDFEPMKLGFRGWSRMLQQQATVVQFAIADPPAAIRVGQPVTVTAQRGDTVTGVIVGREAIVRGDNGETVVWRHVEPEQFEARPVRTEPFDATHVCHRRGTRRRRAHRRARRRTASIKSIRRAAVFNLLVSAESAPPACSFSPPPCC